MKKTSRFVMAVAVLILSSLACRTFQALTSGELIDGGGDSGGTVVYLPTLTPPTIPTQGPATPTVFVEPGPQPTNALLPTETFAAVPGLFVLYDFSDRNSGWPTEYADAWVTDYYQDGYRMLINSPDTVAWAIVKVDYSDVRIVVDAHLIGGGEDNYLGAICRYQNADNFYSLVISSDGYYAIQRRLNGGVIEVISGEYFEQSIVINQQQSLNLIEASCVGDQIKLTVNGLLLAAVTDSAIPSGDAGLIVGTFSAESTDILFDNFTVYLE